MCHHGQGWIRSCIFSGEEGTVMCVTMDKDGLGEPGFASVPANTRSQEKSAHA